jgi:hypothetical protein
MLYRVLHGQVKLDGRYWREADVVEMEGAVAGSLLALAVIEPVETLVAEPVFEPEPEQEPGDDTGPAEILIVGDGSGDALPEFDPEQPSLKLEAPALDPVVRRTAKGPKAR